MLDEFFGVGDSIERMVEVEDAMRSLEFTLGWQVMLRSLAMERINHTRTLKHADDMNTVCRMQSALQMIDWMESLPGIIRTRMQEAQEEVRSGTREPDAGRGYPEL